MTTPLFTKLPDCTKIYPLQIERPAVPVQSDLEYQTTLKSINEMWLMVSRTITKVSSLQCTMEKRRYGFELQTNERFETLQKDINLLRATINRFLRVMDELAEHNALDKSSLFKQQLIEQIKLDMDQSLKASSRPERPQSSEEEVNGPAFQTPDNPTKPVDPR